MYETFVHSEIQKELSEPSSKTFAPSSFRCDRKSWFRLRGTHPDVIEVDRALEHTAMVGTACHREIQSRLIALSAVSDPNVFRWVEVEDYLKEHPIPYSYQIKKDGYETNIEILEPVPVRFSCDGIVFYRGKYYLLEIKTSELGSFSKLTNSKPYHQDQIICYCSLLGLSDVFVVYQERQFGELKCFTMFVTPKQMESVRSRMLYVMKCVEDNIAPNALPVGDAFCIGCVYSKKCKEWGRGGYS